MEYVLGGMRQWRNDCSRPHSGPTGSPLAWATPIPHHFTAIARTARRELWVLPSRKRAHLLHG